MNSHGPLVLPRGSQSLFSPFRLSVVTESRNEGRGGVRTGYKASGSLSSCPQPQACSLLLLACEAHC